MARVVAAGRVEQGERVGREDRIRERESGTGTGTVRESDDG